MNLKQAIVAGLILGVAVGFLVKPRPRPAEVAQETEFGSVDEEAEKAHYASRAQKAIGKGSQTGDGEVGPEPTYASSAAAVKAPVAVSPYAETAVGFSAEDEEPGDRDITKYLPKSEVSKEILDVLDTQDAPGNTDLNVVRRNLEAYKKIIDNPKGSFDAISEAMEKVPPRFRSEREVLLSFVKDLKIDPRDKAEFYLRQAQKPVTSGPWAERDETERITSFDYYVQLEGITSAQKEFALHETLRTHGQNKRLQEGLIRSYDFVEDAPTENLMVQYGLKN